MVLCVSVAHFISFLRSVPRVFHTSKGSFCVFNQLSLEITLPLPLQVVQVLLFHFLSFDEVLYLLLLRLATLLCN